MMNPRFVLALSMVVLAALPLHAGGASDPSAEPEPVDFNHVESLLEKCERLGLDVSANTCRPIVHSVRGQEDVQIANATFDPDRDLTLDLYYPPGYVPADRLPVLLVPMGISFGRMADFDQGRPKDMEFFLGWLPLYAMGGVVAVVYDAEDLIADFDRMLAYLIENEAALGLDMSRIGFWTTSGHGRFASRMLSRPELADRVVAGVFIHADVNPTTIPDRARFFVACSRDGTDFERYSHTFVRRARARGLTVEFHDDVSYKNWFMDDERPEGVAVVEAAVRFGLAALHGDRAGGEE